MGKHAAVFGDLAQGPVDRLNGVGRVDDFADLGRILQEGDEFRPVRAPTLADRGVFAVPFEFKSLQGLFGRGLRSRPIDCLQIGRHRPAFFPPHIA